MTTIDLTTCLATIPDRRRAEGKMYSQVGVILFSIILMVSGARSYRQIHALIKTRLGLLNAAPSTIALRRAPAYTSVRGILQGLDPHELEQAFRRHADGLDRACSQAPSRFIAIDGKTLRQSFDAFADRKAAHVLSAFTIDHTPALPRSSSLHLALLPCRASWFNSSYLRKRAAMAFDPLSIGRARSGETTFYHTLFDGRGHTLGSYSDAAYAGSRDLRSDHFGVLRSARLEGTRQRICCWIALSARIRAPI